MVIFLVLESIIAKDTLSNWQIPHIVFLTYKVRAIVVGKAKWKPLELPLPVKIVNQNQNCLSGRLQRSQPHPHSIILVSLCVRGMKWIIENVIRTSLVAQWLRIRLPMQGARVQSLVPEDPTYRRATKPMHHNY